MLEVNVEAGVREVMRFYEGFENQVDYALARAIATVGLAAQKTQRQHMLNAFDVKRKSWVERNVKVKQFPKKRKPEMIIGMEAPGDPGRSDVLGKFEEGGTKKPKDGRRLAVPADGKKKRVLGPGHKDRPGNIQWQKHGSGPKAEVLIGPGRRFMLKMKDGKGGGVYKRKRSSAGKRGRRASSVGSRREFDLNIGTLFRFTTKARIDKRLDFTENVEAVVRAEFKREFEKELRQAIRSRKRS